MVFGEIDTLGKQSMSEPSQAIRRNKYAASKEEGEVEVRNGAIDAI